MIWKSLVAFDRWLNVNVFRGQNETISDRLGEDLLKKKYGCCKWRVVVCKVLSWIDQRRGNHCLKAIRGIE
jgi:hypothetical protein